MIYRQQISIWKDVPHYVSSGKYKLKQGDKTHLLEQPNSGTLTISNAGEYMEQQELSFTAGGNANNTATLEDILAIYYKAKYSLTVWYSNWPPVFIQWSENLWI